MGFVALEQNGLVVSTVNLLGLSSAQLLIFALILICVLFFATYLLLAKYSKVKSDEKYRDSIMNSDSIYIEWKPLRSETGTIQGFDIVDINQFTYKFLTNDSSRPVLPIHQPPYLVDFGFNNLVDIAENNSIFKNCFKLQNSNKFINITGIRTHNGTVITSGNDETNSFIATREKKKDLCRLEFICEISQQLAAAGVEDYKDVFRETLRKLTYYSGFDRCFLSVMREDDVFDIQYQWAEKKASINLDEYQNISADSFPIIFNILREKGHIYIDSVSTLPDKAVSEKKMLKKMLSESVLISGIFDSDRLVAFLVIDTIHYTASVDENLLRVMKIVGEVLNNTLQRINATFRQFAEEERFKKLFENMPSGFALYKAIYKNGFPVDYELVNANEQFKRLCENRTSPDDNSLGILCPEEKEIWIENYNKVVSGQETKMLFEQYSPTNAKHYEIIATSPEPNYLATIITDRTEKIQARYDLENRIEFESAFSRMLSSLSLLSNDNIDIFLRETLETLCSYCSAERCFVDVQYGDNDISTAYIYDRNVRGFNVTSKSFKKIPGKISDKTNSITEVANINDHPELLDYVEDNCSNETVSLLSFVQENNTSCYSLVLEKSSIGSWQKDSVDMLRIFTETLFSSLKRVSAENSLKESEELFRNIFEQAPAGILQLNYNREIISANKNSLSILNVDSIKQIEGKLLEKVINIPSEQLEKIRNRVEVSLMTSLEDNGRHSQGKVLNLRVTPKKSPADHFLNRAYIVIVDDITQQIQHQAALEEANTELVRSNTDLKQFAYVASHDLQEPVRTITCYLDLLSNELGDKITPEARQYLDFARDGSIRIHLVINDLLQFSKTGFKQLSIGDNDLNEIVKDVLSDLKTAIDNAGAVIKINPLPRIKCDRGQMYRVFINLVSNAIKFTKHGTSPTIEISAKELENSWQFSIKDNGIGIDNQYSEEIFTIFKRLHNKPEYKGTGIGLAICKKAIERHKGRIWVESVPDEGSTFCFTIPTQSNK